MRHTPEPWRIEDEDSIYGGDDFGLLVYEPFSDMLEKDDLIRIVACVNACAGMTNEELEDHGIGGIKEWMDLADETLKAVCIAVDDVDYSGRCEQGIYALKQQREELQATADRFAEIMADKDRQLIAVARQREDLLDALEEYGEHRPSCSIVRWPATAKCDCGFSEALAKARGKK